MRSPAVTRGTNERQPDAAPSRGIERDDSARTFAAGDVEVLAVGPKRIRLIAALGEGEGIARGDEQQAVAERQAGAEARAPLHEEVGSHDTAG